MRAPEATTTTITQTGATAAFEIKGGAYVTLAHGTWGGGNAQLQVLGPDNSTWLNVGSAISADGAITSPLYLAPGQARWNITTTTSAVLCLARVPFD